MLRYLLEKEFKQIRRDRFMPKIIFIIPIMQLIILPFAANFEMRNINLSIVDNDHTVLSRRLTDKVLSSGYFRLADVSPRYDEALVSIESNAADIILEIPSRFEERLEQEGTARICSRPRAPRQALCRVQKLERTRCHRCGPGSCGRSLGTA